MFDRVGREEDDWMTTVEGYRKAASEQKTLRGRLSCNLRMLWHMPSQPVEISIGLGLVAIGALLLVPGDSFYITTPGWGLMRDFLPETISGAMMLLVGMGKVLSAVFGLTRTRHLFSTLAVALLSVVTVSFLSSSFFSIWPFPAVMGLSSAWAVIRQGRPW